MLDCDALTAVENGNSPFNYGGRVGSLDTDLVGAAGRAPASPANRVGAARGVGSLAPLDDKFVRERAEPWMACGAS